MEISPRFPGRRAAPAFIYILSFSSFCPERDGAGARGRRNQCGGASRENEWKARKFLRFSGRFFFPTAYIYVRYLHRPSVFSHRSRAGSEDYSFPRPFSRSIPFRPFLPKVLIAVPVVAAVFFPFMAPPKKKRAFSSSSVSRDD